MEETSKNNQTTQLGIADVSNCKRINGKDSRFNVMWDWEGFAIGLQIRKPHKCTGWEWYIGIDITFLSCWLYF